ncbi:MAG: PqqD family protein [Paludibacter sp.]|nr:PqqD family protein [Paludibacter sp.]
MKIKNGLKIRDIAGEKILVVQGKAGVDLTKVVSFNQTAEWLYNEFVGKDFTVEDMAVALTERFEIDAERATIDAENFVNSLLKANVIE